MKRQLELSVQRQLLLSLMIPMLILWGLTVAISSVRAFDFATETYDHELANSADSVAGRLKYANAKLSVDLPESAKRLILHSANEKFFYAVFDPSGNEIAGDTGMKYLISPLDGPVFADGVLGGDPVRINRIKVDSRDFPHGALYIQVAETMHQRRDYAMRLLVNMVLPDFFLIATILAAVYFGVARGLEPLTRLANSIATRSPIDMSPVTHAQIPREVRPLVEAINGLLGRVASDIESQQRFLADAAHQLRTPVAGLKTYVGYAKRLATEGELSKVLDQIDDGTDRLTHLTNRLLNLAKFEALRRMSENMGPVNLNEIALSGTTEVLPLALQKSVELSFEPDEIAPIVLGNAQSLVELVINLVENAVIYTPSGGVVDVRVILDSASCSLIVQDNGPGIPESERLQVFERFYRVLGTETSGSGLGLAIVKEISESHNARVMVSSGPSGVGTRVTVTMSRIYPVQLSANTVSPVSRSS